MSSRNLSRVAISFSFINVTVAEKSASTYKASPHKPHNMLLLYLLQLGLWLSSTVYKLILAALSIVFTTTVFICIKSLVYVCFCPWQVSECPKLLHKRYIKQACYLLPYQKLSFSQNIKKYSLIQQIYYWLIYTMRVFTWNILSRHDEVLPCAL